MSKKFDRLLNLQNKELLKLVGKHIHVVESSNCCSSGILKEIKEKELILIIFGKKTKTISTEGILEVVIDNVVNS